MKSRGSPELNVAWCCAIIPLKKLRTGTTLVKVSLSPNHFGVYLAITGIIWPRDRRTFILSGRWLYLQCNNFQLDKFKSSAFHLLLCTGSHDQLTIGRGASKSLHQCHPIQISLPPQSSTIHWGWQCWIICSWIPDSCQVVSISQWPPGSLVEKFLP